MTAAMLGQYESAAVLIAAGAKLAACTARGLSAADFARGQSVPEFLTQAFEGNLNGCRRVAALAIDTSKLVEERF